MQTINFKFLMHLTSLIKCYVTNFAPKDTIAFMYFKNSILKFWTDNKTIISFTVLLCFLHNKFLQS